MADAAGLSSRIAQTVKAVRGVTDRTPSVGIILGTGLAGLLAQAKDTIEIPYPKLPHMPVSTAPTHRGQLVFGTIADSSVVVMDGRFHLYEGYTAAEVAYPVQVLRALGVQTLLISNIAGGLNPDFALGDLMLVEDHINLLGTSPLIGPNDDAVGPRFPDMCEPYDKALLTLAEQAGRATGLKLRRGVYIAMPGPQLETRAEYRWIRQMGADAVGMSTVPEVIAAVHAGMKVLTVSLVSDLCIPETLKPVNIEDLIAVANRTEPLLTKLFVEVIRRLEKPVAAHAR